MYGHKTVIQIGVVLDSILHVIFFIYISSWTVKIFRKIYDNNKNNNFAVKINLLCSLSIQDQTALMLLSLLAIVVFWSFLVIFIVGSLSNYKPNTINVFIYIFSFCSLILKVIPSRLARAEIVLSKLTS